MESRPQNHGLCITASVFQWLCDIGAIALDGAIGSGSGGFVLTDKEQESVACGACLIEGITRKNPDALRNLDGKLPQPEFSTSPAARLANWTHLLRCIARLAGTDVDENEKILVVAQDVAVISCVLHRLAAFTSLSATITPRPLSHDILPKNLFGHGAITVLAEYGARHFRLEVEQMERLITLENEKFSFLVFRAGGGSSGPKDNEVALGAWLEELHEHHYRIVDALRDDKRAIRFVLSTLAQGLSSRWKGTVAITARVLAAVAREVWGEAVWLWLVGGPLGQDGLSLIAAALSEQRQHIARQSLCELLVAAARPENLPHALTIELPLRVSGPGALSASLAEVLELLGLEEKCRQELEWHGAVPLVVNQALCDGRVGAAGDGRQRGAALGLALSAFTLFSRCLVGSTQMVDGVLSLHDPRTWAGQPPARRAEGFMAGCRLLQVMVEQRCAVAGRLYRLLLGEWEASYGDAQSREQMAEGLSLVLHHSTSIPLRPLVRPLPAWVKRHGCAAFDVSFWLVLSEHSALEPQDCMALIVLLSSVALCTADTCLDAGLAFTQAAAPRVRHAPVTTAVAAFVKRAFDLLVSMELNPNYIASDVVYKHSPDALEQAETHRRALDQILRKMAAHDTMRAVTEAAVREAAGARQRIDEMEAVGPIVHRVLLQPVALPALSVRGSRGSRRQSPTVPSKEEDSEGGHWHGGDEAEAARGRERGHTSGEGRSGPTDENRLALEGRQHGREEAGVNERPSRGKGTSSKGGRYSDLGQRRKAAREEQTAPEDRGDTPDEQDTEKRDLGQGEEKAEGTERVDALPGADKERKKAKADKPRREVSKPPAGPKRKGSLKGAESVKALQDAFRARGFGSAAAVFVWLDAEERGRLTQVEADRQLKPLRLSQHMAIELHRLTGWSARPDRPVALAEWVQLLGWDPEGPDPEEAAAAARAKRRETASLVRKTIAAAERLYRRKLAADLEEALSKVNTQQQAPPSAPLARASRPVGVAARAAAAVPMEGPKLTPPSKAARPRKQKRPRDRRINISDLGGTMVEAPPAEKALSSVEKMLLEAFARANPLAHTEPDTDDTWLLASQRQYRLLPRQLVRVGQLDKACKVLCSLHFLQEAVKELGAYWVLDQLQLLWKALHQGQGRDNVDDYLDFVEHHADALSDDPSRIFDLARQEPEVSQVYKDAHKAIVVGDTTVRQAQARVARLEGSSASALAKAVAYCRTQRSIARLMGRGITGCFSKAQLEKYKKALQFVAACAQTAQDQLSQQPLSAHAPSIHALLAAVSQDDAQARANAFYDLMDALTPILPDPMPSLPPLQSPRRDAADVQREQREELEGILGSSRHVRLFLSAPGDDQASERRFLSNFVLPGLRVQCSANHLDFGWCDPGGWGKGRGREEGVEVIGRRLQLMDQCYIHSAPLDPNDDGHKQRVPFGLLLLSTRFEEPTVSESALRERSELLEEFPRVACQDGQLGACDAEVQHAFLSRSDPRSFVFLTDADYLADDAFVREVPEAVRMPLLEASTAESVPALKSAVLRKVEELGETEEEGLPAWRAVTYPTGFAGVSKDVRASQGELTSVGSVRLSGMEVLGVQVFQRLWGILARTYPRPEPLDVLEREEAEQEATRFLTTRSVAVLRCREELVATVVDFVRGSFTSTAPKAAALCLTGPHGIGLTSMTATVAERLLELDDGGPHVICYQQQPWHSASHLLWFLCSEMGDRNVARPSWQAFIDLCCARRDDPGTALVLDALTVRQQEEVAEALARARKRGASVSAVMCGTGAASSSSAAASSSSSLAAKSTELVVPPLERDSVRAMVDHVVAGLSAHRRIDDGLQASLAAKTFAALDSLLGAGGTGAVAAGLPLLVQAACVLAVEGGVSALETLRHEVESMWHDNMLPLLERRHGPDVVRWALLALHYEPCGLRVSQLCFEAAAAADKRDPLPLDETACSVGPRAEALARDLALVLPRGQGPFGQVLVLDRASLKAAVELRYIDNWKRVEEDAAAGRPGAAGVLAPPMRRLPTLQSVMARTPSSFKLIGVPRDPSPTKLNADRPTDRRSPSKPASAARRRILSARAQSQASEVPSPDRLKAGDVLAGDDETEVKVTSFLSDVEGRFDWFCRFVALSRVLSWGTSEPPRLELADGAGLVVGGGCQDKGPGDERIVRLLVQLQERHPDRVTLLVGPRECHKLRVLSELSDECLADKTVADDASFPPWVPEEVRVTPSKFLEREGLEDSRVSRLRWMLSETMDAAGAFEWRREELAATLKTDVDDHRVLQSFLDQVTPGHEEAWVLRYVERGRVAHCFGSTLFVHGALRDDSLGVVPGQDQPVPDMARWVEALNAWYSRQVSAYKERPTEGKNGPSRAAQGLIDYGVVREGSVVCGRCADGSEQLAGVGERVAKTLSGHAVTNIVCGGTPQGHCPTVSRDHDVMVVCASVAAAESSVTEVLVHANGSVQVHGTLHDGREVDYTVDAVGEKAGDAFVGRLMPDGRRVRAKTSAGEYVVSEWQGDGFVDSVVSAAEVTEAIGGEDESKGGTDVAEAEKERPLADHGGDGNEEPAHTAPVAGDAEEATAEEAEQPPAEAREGEEGAAGGAGEAQELEVTPQEADGGATAGEPGGDDEGQREGDAFVEE